MQTNRPLILVTNDDSVEAPGFHHLIESVKEFADVIGVAPAEPQSGQSSAISVNKPLFITEVKYFSTPQTPIFKVNGTPVDCVKLAMHAIVPRRPDLILSGINHGSNSAVNVIYSGTMGAVLEGCLIGIPSIGFSMLDHSWAADLNGTTLTIKKITGAVLQHGLPVGICLNVNIPAGCTPEGIKVTRSAKGCWNKEYAEYTTPEGRQYYWLTGYFDNVEPTNSETDEYWLSRGWATVVPTAADMTAHDCISGIKTLLQLSD